MPDPDLCELFKQNTEKIIGLWEAAAHREPWHLLPQEERTDHLPAVIDAIADGALCPDPSRDSMVHLAHEAATHGQHRRRQGQSHHLILTEFYLLREAIWDYLKLRGPAGEEEMDAIARIDVMITLATRASMVGFHRELLAGDRPFEFVIERLVDDVPLLALR